MIAGNTETAAKNNEPGNVIKDIILSKNSDVSVLPAIIVQIMGMQQGWALFYGGTSLLIMVGVAIDTIQQINAYLLNRHYDGLMKTGKKRKLG